jgi:hypothetical protein
MMFFHQSFLKIPPHYAIGATFKTHVGNGGSHWMFQDVHERGPATLEVGRTLQSEGVPPSWHLPAIIVFAAALILQGAVMIVNPFLAPALHIPAERGNRIISRGSYRYFTYTGKYTQPDQSGLRIAKRYKPVVSAVRSTLTLRIAIWP